MASFPSASQLFSKRSKAAQKRKLRKNRVSLMQQLEDRRMLAVLSDPSQAFPTVDQPVAVGLGTFAGDANPDAVILGADGDLTLAQRAAGDNWQTIETINTGLGPQQTLVAERLSADPQTDLVTQSADSISVLHNDVAGGFTVVQTIATPSAGGFASSFRNTLSIDFVDADFSRDLVAVASADNSVAVYPGLAGGTFAAPTTYNTGVSTPTTAVVADVIGDELPDLIVGHADGSIVFFEGVSSSSTLQRRDDLTLNAASAVTSFGKGDFDNDGNIDLAVTTSTETFLLFSSDDPRATSAIVNGDFSAGLTGWETEIVGHDSTGTPGRVNGLGGTAQLTENESFITSLNQTLVIPDGATSLSFDLVALGLDPMLDAVPDAFEVSLLDDSQQSLVPTHDPDSTAFFNISSGSAASAASGVSVNGSTVTLDVASLAAGTTAKLTFDLIGNPPGTSSVATIDNVTIDPKVVLSDNLDLVSLPGTFADAFDSTVGDFDGDGNLDIVVADSNDTLTVLFGDGGRGFTDDVIDVSGSGSGLSSVASAPLTAGDDVDDLILTLSGSDLALSPIGADVTSPDVNLLDPIAGTTIAAFAGSAALEFSEAVRTSGTGSVTNLDAYTLTGTGDDGLLGTADDVVIPLESVTYDDTTLTATVTVSPTALPLADDNYQVTLSGDDPITAIRDLVGNAVGGGGDVGFEFTVDAPLALATPATTTVAEGSPVTISTAFDDPGRVGGYAATIDWGDGTSEDMTVDLDASGFAGTLFASHVYADNEAYNVSITLTDARGEVITVSPDAQVTNADPVLSDLNDIMASENATVSFDLATITDAGFTFGTGEETFTAAIDWGDGSPIQNVTDINETVTGPVGPTTATLTAMHAYASEGVFDVTITVTDDDGGAATGTLQAFISNTAPILAPLTAIAANEGDSVSVSGTYTDDDLNGTIDPATIHTVTINWGDGTVDNLTPSATTGNEAAFDGSHTYADDGDYTVTVTVADSGTGAAMQSAIATISGVTPSATPAANAIATVGASTTFALASFSDPGFTNPTAGTSETFTVEIDWGDGSAIDTNADVVVSDGSPGVLTTGLVSGSHTFASAGTYTAVATITDDDGLSTTASIQISVEGGSTTGACIPSIGFDHGITGVPIPAGSVITDQWALWGVHVTTDDPVNHPAMIFDSSAPTGGDTDLGTPNSQYGGPGQGSGGASNDIARGNVLIISEDADSSDPDDNASGGTLIFTFDNPVQLDEISLLDLDTSEDSTITLYDASDNIISTTTMVGSGNNALQTFSLDADNVARMEVSLSGSGAITDLVFCRDLPTMTVFGDNVTDEGNVYEALLLSPGVNVTDWNINVTDDSGSQISNSEILNSDSPTFSTVFPDGENTYTITGWATDGANVYTLDAFAVDVANVDPTLTISGDLDAQAQVEYTLDLSSTDPGDDTLIQWIVDWGDGNTDVINGNPDTVAHTYAVAGNFTISATAYDEDNAVHSGQGLIILQAEDFDASQPGTGGGASKTWTATTDSDASGDAYLLASPNTGFNAGDSTSGPRLDYTATFDAPGTYYAWVRMLGSNGSNDSLHLGLNGQSATYGKNGMTDSSGDWHWEQNVNNRSGADRVTINVPSAGTHTINLWMREDGTAVDKIILTDDANFTPTGFGPDPTITGDAYVSNTLDITVAPGDSVWLPNVDFSVDASGIPLDSGDRITDQFASLGFTVSTNDANKPAMIFDSSQPSGGDNDLGSPNSQYGGPGQGSGGASNSTALGNLLIVSEDNDASDPDDNGSGGVLIFDFDQVVMVDELGLLDVQSGDNHIDLFDVDENLISSTDIPDSGDNGYSRVALNALGVTRMEVHLSGSGGISDIEFCREGGYIPAAQTRFFVTDSSDDDIYRYNTSGAALGDFDASAAYNPRGITTTADGNPVWVVSEEGSNERVYVYDTDGETLLGDWNARGLTTPEGIATDGTDIWIVDDGIDKVKRYSGAASRTSGEQFAASEFQLAYGNSDPRGITTDGQSIWVVDGHSDKVFAYEMDGTFINWWNLESANSDPAGITINPAGGDGVWVVDASDDTVYHYANATLPYQGDQTAIGTFPLDPDNTNPTGIADPVMMANLGDVIADTIAAGGETDEWQFDASAGMAILVDFQSLGGSNISVNFTAPDGAVLFNTTQFFGLAGMDTARIELTQTGTYTYAVSANDSASYQFEIVEIIDDPTVAFNIGDVVSGSFDPIGQIDTFTFNADAGTRIALDRIDSVVSAGYNIIAPSGAVVRGAAYFDSPPFELPETGQYQMNLAYTGSNGSTDYEFVFNDITEVFSTPVVLNELVEFDFDFVGRTNEFTFDINAPTDIVLDALAVAGTIDWELVAPSGDVVSSFFILTDRGKTPLTEIGTYTFRLSSVNATGLTSFILWDSSDIGPITASVDTTIDQFLAPQQNANYEFQLIAGQELIFDVKENASNGLPPFAASFTLTAPDGTDVLTSVVGDQGIFTVPQTGTYTLDATTFNPAFIDETGNVSFRLQNRIIPPVSTTADSSGSEFVLSASRGVFAGTTARLVLTAEQDSQAVIELPGLGWINAVDIPASGSTIVDLPSDVLLNPFTPEAIEVKSIQILADSEIRAFVLLDAFSSGDATTGLPVDTLGTEYLVETYLESCPLGCQQSQIAVVATEDDTVATITAPIEFGEIGAKRPANVPFDIFLDAGQTYVFKGGGFVAGPGFSPIGLSGTEIVSTKPVAVYGGNPETFVPTVGAADILSQQMVPISAWGTRYASVPLAGRVGGDTFRVMASQDATDISINGTVVATLNRGEFYETILDTAAEFTADSPIMVTRFGHGGEFDQPGAPDDPAVTTGDPLMITLVPTEQFDTDFIVENESNGINDHYLSVTTLTSGIDNVTVDGITVDSALFQPIGDGTYSGAAFNVPQGIHSIGSSTPMSVEVYGYGNFDSYGYYGGARISPVGRLASLGLDPATATLLPGDPHTLTASVTDSAGDPLADVRVDFTVTGTVDTTSFAYSGPDGLVSFTYTSNDFGNETVTASVGNIDATASVNWLGAPPTISVDSPSDGDIVVSDQTLIVTGQALPGPTLGRVVAVTIDGRRVDSVDAAGNYFALVTPTDGANAFELVATDEFGQTATTTISLTGEADVPFDLDSLADSTLTGELKFATTTFNRSTNVLHTEATLRATANQGLSQNTVVAFDPINPLRVTLDNSDITLPSGGSDASATGEGLSFASVIPASGLTNGQSSSLREIDFANPDRDRFDFQYRILSNQNFAPNIESAPVTRATVGQTYEYSVVAEDANNDTLEYTLVTGPATASINANGVLSWSPVESDRGTHDVQISVDDGRGGVASQSFTLTATDALANRAPAFTTAPLTTIPSGSSYDFTVNATDPDGDQVLYSLDTAPTGMTIDASGRITFTPPADGNYQTIVRASDAAGASSTLAFNLAVGDGVPFNSAPVLIGDFPTEAFVDSLYMAFPAATDADGDNLTFSLLSAPAGMTLTTTLSESGNAQAKLEYTPSAADLGPQAVLLSVSDGNGAFATRSFTIEVTPTPDPLAPAFESTPSRFATVGEAYPYTAVATDPDGDDTALTYSKINGPAGLSIDGVTGAITYTPDAADLGDATITVQATDADGLSATQTWTLSVRPTNVAPEFISTPGETVSAGARYRYDAVATDADDNVTYTLVTSPAEMKISRNSGLLFWRPQLADIGDVDVTIRATDDRGLFTDQNYTLSVTADTTAPIADVFISDSPIQIGETSRITVMASDDVAIDTLVLTVDGVVVPIDSQSGYTFTGIQAGVPNVILTASDTSGNVTTATLDPELRVLDLSDTTSPVIEITSPAPADVVTYLTDVVGSVTDDNLEFYEVQVSLAGQNDFTTIERRVFQPGPGGTGPVDEVLGVFDPTMLANDTYDLRVVAQDVNGNVATLSQEISVEAQAKLGNFRIELTDLAIPLAGIPIQINRTYDTLDAPYNGDFGYGWKLDVATPRIRESVRTSALEAAGAGIFGANAFRAGTRVYMNAPNGRRVGFTFDPVPEAQLLGTLWRPRFTADPGVYERLEVADVPLSQNEDGTFGLYLLGFAYNPSEYTLVTKDQLRYTYDQFADIQLQTITDRNDVTLTFDDTGIHSSVGPEITWTRDDQGRITEILDTAGNPLTYTYTTSGDLESFTDQVGNVTSMTYLDDPAHYLESITDPRDIQVLSLGYDEGSRLTGQGDALGNSSNKSYDLDNNTEVIADRLGNETTLKFDDRGNVTRVTDALGQTISVTYDANDNEASFTSSLGATVSYTHDESGNVTSETNPLGRTWTVEYDSFNNPTRFASPNGSQSVMAYDASGNLTTVVDAAGASTTMELDQWGRAIAKTDPNGNQVEFTYSPTEVPTQMRHPDGATRRVQYNQFQKPVLVVDELGNETRFEYDAVGDLTKTIDAIGQEFVYEYLDRRLTVATMPNGDVFRYEYDERGNRVSETYPDGGVYQYTYDPEDRVITKTTPLGRLTTFNRDANGQVIEEVDPVGQSTRFEYNAEGNKTAEIDRLSRRTEFAYDLAGNRIQVINPDGTEYLMTYDEIDRLASSTDERGATTTFVYDGRDRVIERVDANGGVHRKFYDGVGNLIREIDPAGMAWEWQYDNRNRLSQVTTPLTGTTVYELDTAGNRVSVTDADGRRSEIEYDALLRDIRETDPDGGTTYQTFNVYNRISSITDELGRTDYYQTDYFDRPISHIDARGETQSWAWNVDGDLLSVTDFSGNVTTYLYDDRGSVISETDPLSNVRSYTNDAEGNRIEAIDAMGRRRTFAYDWRDNITDETWYNADGSIAEVLTYHYDVRGDLIGADQGQTSVSHSRDSLGRMTQTTLEFASVDPWTLDYTHAANGMITSVLDHSGVRVESDYGPNGLLSRRTWTGLADNVSAAIDLAYTDAGLVEELIRYSDAMNGVDPVGHSRLSYSQRGVTSVIQHFDPTDVVLSELDLQRDAADQIVGMAVDGGTERNFAHDATGQLLTADRVDGAEQVFEYDGAGNRIGSDIVVGPGNQLLSDATFTYTYDAEGNLAEKIAKDGSVRWAYTYDHRNRLTSVRAFEAGGDEILTVDYGYDALDRLVRREEDADGQGPQASTIEFFIHDGDDVWADLNGDGDVTARYLVGDIDDQRFARWQTGQGTADGLAFYLSDHLQSVRGIVDSIGELLASIDYDAFGHRTITGDAAAVDRYGFTGREHDDSVGLMRYRARFYDPSTGKFINRDPIGFDGGDGNLYRYVANAPLTNADPTGNATTNEYAIKVDRGTTGVLIRQKFKCIGKEALEELPNLLFTGPQAYLADVGFSAISCAVSPVAGAGNKKFAELVVKMKVIGGGKITAKLKLGKKNGISSYVLEAVAECTFPNKGNHRKSAGLTPKHKREGHHLTFRGHPDHQVARAALLACCIGVDSTLNLLALSKKKHRGAGLHARDNRSAVAKKIEGAQGQGCEAVAKALQEIKDNGGWA